MRRSALTLLTLVLCGRTLTAQAHPQPSAQSTWASDSAAIVAGLATSVAGWNRHDLAAFHSSYVDSAVIISTGAPGQPPQVFRSVAASRPSYNSILNPPSTLSAQTLVLKPIGTDAAMHVIGYTLKQPGRPDVVGSAALVWARTPAGWRILLDHSP